MKVSSRTYEEEIRRRNESQPVKVINCSNSEESASKPIDNSVNKLIDISAKSPIEEEQYMSKYVCIFIIFKLVIKYPAVHYFHVLCSLVK